MDGYKNLIFNGLKVSCFNNHFALTIIGLKKSDCPGAIPRQSDHLFFQT